MLKCTVTNTSLVLIQELLQKVKEQNIQVKGDTPQSRIIRKASQDIQKIITKMRKWTIDTEMRHLIVVDNLLTFPVLLNCIENRKKKEDHCLIIHKMPRTQETQSSSNRKEMWFYTSFCALNIWIFSHSPNFMMSRLFLVFLLSILVNGQTMNKNNVQST